MTVTIKDCIMFYILREAGITVTSKLIVVELVLGPPKNEGIVVQATEPEKRDGNYT